MIPIEESFIRAITLLGGPKPTEQRAEIVPHLDTTIDYARDDTEERLAHSFKVMALNHLDSIGRDTSTIVEEKMELALIAAEELILAIVERNQRGIRSERCPCRERCNWAIRRPVSRSNKHERRRPHPKTCTQRHQTKQ